MVNFYHNLAKFKNKSLSVSISPKIFVSLVDHSRKNLECSLGLIDKQKLNQTPPSERRETTSTDIIIMMIRRRMMMVTAQLF